MTRPSEKVVNVYESLLKLYPVRFQKEYGEEMIAVFRKAYSEAANFSFGAKMRLILHELRDLPVNVIKEHWSEFWREPMETKFDLRETLLGSIFKGMASFSVGNTLVFLIFCLIDTLINTGNNAWNGKSIWNSNLNYLHPTAIAYCLSAVIMGIKKNKRKAWLSGLGALLIYTLTYRIWMSVPLEQQNYLISTGLEPYILSTVSGIFVGGIIGIIQQGWNKAGWFALAGAIGFNLGWLTRNAVIDFLLAHTPNVYFFDLIKVGDPWYFLLTVIPVLFYGAVVGICLGLSSARLNHPQQLQSNG
ncbi:MAG: hypothetical protein VB013_00165 [Anaerolineaceae bacterium]|nr:hypothetical protein [Anaerolineaceae bacterium]